MGFGRVFVTVLVAAAGIAAAFFLWQTYGESPWTRDGRVRADIVQIAPDVSGPIVSVEVRDNQVVRQGDVLLTIDPERFRLAVAQAEATLHGRESEREQRRRESERRNRLTTLAITEEAREQAATALASAEAAYRQAEVELNTARLNLERTTLRSPVNGYVTNRQVNPGDYAAAGKGLLAVVDSDSFYVYGYFEENKLARIRESDPVSIRLMAYGDPLRGHVESISRAIADREAPDTANLIANVNPSFTWVRLAQRIPVRIAIDRRPENLRLTSGMSATVVVEPGPRGP